MKIPRILDDYLEETGQKERGELSESHLLEEAEWQLYQTTQESSSAYEYPSASKRALKRYVDNLRARGVEPRHDFEI